MIINLDNVETEVDPSKVYGLQTPSVSVNTSDGAMTFSLTQDFNGSINPVNTGVISSVNRSAVIDNRFAIVLPSSYIVSVITSGYIELYNKQDKNCPSDNYIEETLAPCKHNAWHPLDIAYGVSSAYGTTYIGVADADAFDINNIYNNRYNSEYDGPVAENGSSFTGLAWNEFSPLHDCVSDE